LSARVVILQVLPAGFPVRRASRIAFAAPQNRQVS